MPTGELVVCTRNRPDDMQRLAVALAEQTLKPAVLVVDASDTDSTRQVIRRLGEAYPVTLRWVSAEPGLTRQRMTGIGMLLGDTRIVHFLDDDSVPEPEYFAAVEHAFAALPDALGIGGLIVDAAAYSATWLDRFFLVGARREGVVLPSGIAVPYVGTRGSGEPAQVDWLSGCAMSYRRELFARIEFDSTLTGYSYGEDVDFGFRASRLGPLYVAREARLTHRSSLGLEPGAEFDDSAFARQALSWRRRLVYSLRGEGLSPVAFWWSVLGSIVLAAGRGTLCLKRSWIRRAAHVALAAVQVGLHTSKGYRVRESGGDSG